MPTNERIIDVIEAAYRFTESNDAWLADVVSAMSIALHPDRGCAAFFYDASDVERLRVRGMIGAIGDPERTMRAIEAFEPLQVRTMFRGDPVAFASESPVWPQQPAAKMLRAAGVDDLFFVNGVDPTGVGCFIGVRQPRGTISRADRELWSRVAAHLASGCRLQRALGRMAGADLDSAEAVLSPRGSIENAGPEAKDARARATLREAVLALERARGRLRKDDPPAAVGAWRGLVAARWTLVDSIDTDGRRYIVARRNLAEVRAPAALTPRERQVVAYARLGHANKLIAYELGISASTVGVLISRAARKLGASSRSELFAAFDAAGFAAAVPPK